MNYARNISIINNTVVSNATRLTYYGGIAVDHDLAQNVVVRNNIVCGNPGFQLKTSLNPQAIVDHNLTSDPRFARAAGDDFHLQAGSPAIDAGSSTNAPAFDFDNQSRPHGAGFDIGAFEYWPKPGMQLPGQ